MSNRASKPLDISLFFFSSGETSGPGTYDHVVEAARFADRHDLRAVWVPERHFMQIGCLYPSPALLLAALARETTRVELRAGSVVVPLHDPVRLAEEWAMLDHLSGGRCGMACASGWHPNDFVLAPDRYDSRRQRVLDDIAIVRRLWRGERLTMPRSDGHPVTFRTYPTPLSRTLPIWLTSAGNPETFAAAGAIGANLLTYVALFDLHGLEERIALYRRSLAEHGFVPEDHTVTVWVQAWLGGDGARARAEATAAMRRYFQSDARDLFSGLVAHHTGHAFPLDALDDRDIETYVGVLTDRLIANGVALFGTPAECLPAVERLARAGVDELACQVDFATSREAMLATLPYLAELNDAYNHTRRPARGKSADIGLRPGPPALESIAARCRTGLDAATLYARLRDAGFDYGPLFRRVTSVRRGDGESLARISSADLRSPDTDAIPHALVLDAALHGIFAALPEIRDNGWRAGAMVAEIGSFEPYAPIPAECWSHASVRTQADGALDADVTLYDDAGRRLVAIAGIRITGSHRRPDGVVDRLYTVAWRERRAGASAAAERTNRLVVLLLSDDTAFARDVQRELEARRHDVRRAADLATSAVGAELFGVDAVVDLRMLAAAPQSGTGAELGSIVETCARRVDLVRRVVTAAVRPRVWTVTAAAMAVAEGDAADLCLAHTPAWGLMRTAALEHPELRCTLVDLPAAPLTADARQLAELVASDDDAAELGLRGGAVFEPRLVPLEFRRSGDSAIRSDATYLITGGTGALGLRVARRLVDRGARALMLCARRPASSVTETAVADLQRLGADVRVSACDITAREDVDRLLCEIAATMPPLRGVIHAAGVLDDAVITNQTPQRLATVLAPKVAGAQHLHELTLGVPLDFFVSFSSAAAVLGSPGQANYAAANAFLGALAAWRRAAGLPSTAIHWGPWADTGMAATLLASGPRAHAEGMRLLAPADALDAFESVLQRDLPDTVIVDADWARVASDAPPAVARLVSELASPLRRDRGRTSLRDAIASGTADAGRTLREYIEGEICAVTGIDATALSAEAPLGELGIDSLMAVVLKNRIATDLLVDVPVGDLLDAMTLSGLVSRIESRLAVEAPPQPLSAIGAAEAEQLLADMDGLTDAQVEMLLARFSSQEAP